MQAHNQAPREVYGHGHDHFSYLNPSFHHNSRHNTFYNHPNSYLNPTSGVYNSFITPEQFNVYQYMSQLEATNMEINPDDGSPPEMMTNLDSEGNRSFRPSEIRHSNSRYNGHAQHASQPAGAHLEAPNNSHFVDSNISHQASRVNSNPAESHKSEIEFTGGDDDVNGEDRNTAANQSPDGVKRGIPTGSVEIKADIVTDTNTYMFPSGKGYTLSLKTTTLDRFICMKNDQLQAELKVMREGLNGIADDEHAVSVKKIMQAFVNLEKVVDKPTKAEEPAQAVKNVQYMKYTAEGLESLAWDLYVSLISNAEMRKLLTDLL
jgi:hypothetical protein